MDPEPSPLRTSDRARLTRVDISVDNLEGRPIDFNLLKLDLDKLFEKLRRTYESDDTIDKSVYKMRASVQTCRFLRKLTSWVYFHLKYHHKEKVHCYIDSPSPPGSDETTRAHEERNGSSDEKTKTTSNSDSLMRAARVTARKFVSRFFGKAMAPPDKPESQHIHSAVRELQKELSDILQQPGNQSSPSPVREGDLLDVQSVEAAAPPRKVGKIPTPGFSFPFRSRDPLPTATATSEDSDSSKRKRRSVKRVSFDRNLSRTRRGDGDELRRGQGISRPRSTNPFENSDDEEEEEARQPAPDGAPQQGGAQAWNEPKALSKLENNKSERAGVLGDERYNCATCNGVVGSSDIRRFVREMSHTLRCSTCIKSGIPSLVSAVICRLLDKYPRECKHMFLKQHSEHLQRELIAHLQSQLGNKKNYEIIQEVNAEHFAKVVTKHLLGIYNSPRKLVNAAVTLTHSFRDDFTTFVKFELAQKRTYQKQSFFKRMILPLTRAVSRATQYIYDRCSPTTQVMFDLSCFGHTSV